MTTILKRLARMTLARRPRVSDQQQQPELGSAISDAEQYDIANVLDAHRDLIERAYDLDQFGLGGGNLSVEEISLRAALEACGVLASGGTLQHTFRRVLGSVMGTRAVREAAIQDYLKVASRYADWNALPLSAAWAILASNDRNTLKQVRE
jgi:hypothetical protein